MFVVDPALALLLILLIGIAVGLLMYRYAGSRWLTQFTSTRRGYLTSVRIPVKATTLSGAWRPRDPVDDDQGGARA
jgi:hypothetical protein